MKRLNLVFVIIISKMFLPINGYGQNLPNIESTLDSLNRFYSTFKLGENTTHKNKITLEKIKPTKAKNDVILSDSVLIINILHSNDSSISGSILIGIDVSKGFYMYSSKYFKTENNKHKRYESSSVHDWWYPIKNDAPVYIYSPLNLSKMLK